MSRTKSTSGPKYKTVDPQSVELTGSETRVPTQELLTSIRRYGVLAPVLASEGPDGGLTVLAGHCRTIAAQQAGQPLPVRVLTGTPLEQLLQAFNEEMGASKRSIVEHGQQVREIIREAEASGITPTIDWLQEALGACRGKAHYLKQAAMNLSPERLTDLAQRAGLELDTVLAMPVVKARVLAKEDDDAKATVLLQELMAPAKREPQHESPSGLGRRIIEWVIRLLVSVRASIARLLG